MSEQLPPPPAPSGEVVNQVVAAILNWIYPGAAYFLLGQTSKGVVMCAVTLVMWLLLFLTCGFGVLLLIPYTVVAIIDAVKLSARVNRGEKLQEWQFF
jgi:TM2 domain-containing membrane protein YozV